MKAGLNLRCVQCKAPLSVNEPTIHIPDEGEVCWMCQQPEEYRQMSSMSALPILDWAQKHFGTDIVAFQVSHICDSLDGYARCSHLSVLYEDKFAIQMLDGSIKELSEVAYRLLTESK